MYAFLFYNPRISNPMENNFLVQSPNIMENPSETVCFGAVKTCGNPILTTETSMNVLKQALGFHSSDRSWYHAQKITEPKNSFH